jgi:transaldolase
MPADGGDSEKTLAEFAKAGVDADALAADLQDAAAKSFVDAWNDLITHIDQQGAALGAVAG